MIKKIVSGGQTGVDQAAFSIAMEVGIEIGGWCTKGGLDANGVDVLSKYLGVREATTADPNERTRLNINDSDGTLIVVPCIPMPAAILDGTLLTIEYAQHIQKPHLIIGLLSKDNAISIILDWVRTHNIRTLNIGGPRESS